MQSETYNKLTCKFLQLQWYLCHHAPEKYFMYFCKKATEMTAKVIRYIGFSLYNCMEKTVYRVWKKPVKLEEFYFAKYVSTLLV